MQIDFVKMTGAGNDFVLIDNRSMKISADWGILTPKLCDRRYGIGADGLLVVEPSGRAAFMMKYYNADGSYGGMCGNGGRCISRYVMGTNKVSQVAFEALDHIYHAQARGAEVELAMKNPTPLKSMPPMSLLGEKLKVHFIDTGAPHAILLMDELPERLKTEIERTGLMEIGSAIRYHEAFQPSGTNVDFLHLRGENQVEMRTYERGVEEETLACGTGAVASALAVATLYGYSSPLSVITRSREVLKVEFQKEGVGFRNVRLIGSAKIVFCGEIEVDV